jgi:HTH-type transcriptional regulator/antitoxin HigA
MTTARRPAEVFAPGVFVRDELEERGWSQTDLADILDRPVGLVNELIAGKRGISPETAKGLAAAFGTSPELWMNLEAAYQLSRVGKDAEHDITRRAKMYNKAPLKDMIRRGWVEPSDNVDVLERRLLHFYRIDSLDDEPQLFAHAARKSTSYWKATTTSQLAWLCRARHVANTVGVESYSAKNLEMALNRLCLLYHQPQEARHVPRILAEAGIRFVVVQPLSGSKIDGACFWVDKSPVVAMSLRFDRIDNFWFVLMHELGHVSKGELSIDEDMKPEPESLEKPGSEIQADQFALDHLIPQEKLAGFMARVGPLYSAKRIEAFARTINVHPGIVVGQLQYRQQVPYSSFRKTLHPIRDIVTASTITDGWGFALPSDL